MKYFVLMLVLISFNSYADHSPEHQNKIQEIRSELNTSRTQRKTTAQEQIKRDYSHLDGVTYKQAIRLAQVQQHVEQRLETIAKENTISK